MYAVFGTLKLLPGKAISNSLAGAYTGRCRFFALNNPKQTSCKSPDQEIEAAGRIALRLKVASSKFSIVAEK